MKRKTRNGDAMRVTGEPKQMVVDVDVEYENWDEPKVSVRTYKGAVVVCILPDATLWLDVKGAQRLAAALLRVAKRRTEIDAHRKRRR